MKTVNKLQYNLLKLKQNVLEQNNETVEISDEEYAKYYEVEPIDEQEDTIEPQEEIYDYVDDYIKYKIYETYNGELILNISILNNSYKYKIQNHNELSDYTYKMDIHEGINIITPFIAYCNYDNEVNKYYISLCKYYAKFNEQNYENIYKILFNLKQNKSNYSYNIAQSPTFEFLSESPTEFTLKLLTPLIINNNYNETIKEINDINMFTLYVNEINLNAGQLERDKLILQNNVNVLNSNKILINYDFKELYNSSQFNVSKFQYSTIQLKILYGNNINVTCNSINGFGTQHRFFYKQTFNLFSGPSPGTQSIVDSYGIYNYIYTY